MHVLAFVMLLMEHAHQFDVITVKQYKERTYNDNDKNSNKRGQPFFAL